MRVFAFVFALMLAACAGKPTVQKVEVINPAPPPAPVAASAPQPETRRFYFDKDKVKTVADLMEAMDLLGLKFELRPGNIEDAKTYKRINRLLTEYK